LRPVSVARVSYVQPDADPWLSDMAGTATLKDKPCLAVSQLGETAGMTRIPVWRAPGLIRTMRHGEPPG